jgi:hypothetical protein
MRMLADQQRKRDARRVKTPDRLPDARRASGMAAATQAQAMVRLVTERVVPSLAGVRWDPNTPAAVLIVTDAGLAALALRPHPDDVSDDCVVLVWSGTREAVMGTPNDEALPGHRLYERGLARLKWAGAVEDSERIAGLE